MWDNKLTCDKHKNNSVCCVPGQLLGSGRQIGRLDMIGVVWSLPVCQTLHPSHIRNDDTYPKKNPTQQKHLNILC